MYMYIISFRLVMLDENMLLKLTESKSLEYVKVLQII